MTAGWVGEVRGGPEAERNSEWEPMEIRPECEPKLQDEAGLDAWLSMVNNNPSNRLNGSVLLSRVGGVDSGAEQAGRLK